MTPFHRFAILASKTGTHTYKMRIQSFNFPLTLLLIFGSSILLTGCHGLVGKEKRREMHAELDTWEQDLAIVWADLDANVTQVQDYKKQLGTDSILAGQPVSFLGDSAIQAEYTGIAESCTESSRAAYRECSDLKMELTVMRSWVDGLVHAGTTRKQATRSWNIKKNRIQGQFESLERVRQFAIGQVWLMKQFADRKIQGNSEPVSPVP